MAKICFKVKMSCHIGKNKYGISDKYVSDVKL